MFKLGGLWNTLVGHIVSQYLLQVRNSGGQSTDIKKHLSGLPPALEVCVRANRAKPMPFNHMLCSDYSIFFRPLRTFFPSHNSYTSSMLDIVLTNGLRDIFNIETIDVLDVELNQC
jgi:hypothetical protein